LEIENAEISIPVDLWTIFENILPLMLQNIVTFYIVSFNDKNHIKEKIPPKIILSVYKNSNIIELNFIISGYFAEISKQTKAIEEVILFAKNNGGKIFIKSVSETKSIISFKFQMENELCDYIILKSDNQYYAILSKLCSYISNRYSRNTDNISHNIHINSLYNKKITDNYDEIKYVIIDKYPKKIMLGCDEIIGTATLSPKRLTGTLSTIPYAIGAAQFGDKSVLLLDIEAIYQFLMK
jgi:hypothetical protein